MAVEIEVKLSVLELNTPRARLVELGAQRLGKYLETNVFLDTEDRTLLAADEGLRLRHKKNLETSQNEFIITYKGPRQPGALMAREEIEFTGSDGDQAKAFLAALSFSPTLSFEKRRESWQFADCKVELDEVPHLGTFVEIEGPSEASVESTRKTLRLESLPVITKSYAALLADFLDEHRMTTRSITFGESDG